jgi:hypothetical protein
MPIKDERQCIDHYWFDIGICIGSMAGLVGTCTMSLPTTKLTIHFISGVTFDRNKI